MVVALPSFRGLHGWLAVAFLAWSLGCGTVRAASSIVVPTEIGSGISVELDTPLAQPPVHGLFPLLVKIHNGSADAGFWTVATGGYGGGSVNTSTTINVQPAQSASVWIYASVGSGAMFGMGGYRQVYVRVTGSKVVGASWNTSFTHPGRASVGPGGPAQDIPYLGLSIGVAGKGEAALQNQYKKDFSGADLDSIRVNLETEFPDWRAFAGLGQLWMTDEEWSSLSASSRGALMDWLSLGGRLVLVTRDIGATHVDTLKIPAENAGGQRRVGAGNIFLLRWNGSDLPMDQAMALLAKKDGPGSSAKLVGNYFAQWRLPGIVGVFTVHGWLIFGFMLIFGVLVGPVNLFYFAGPQRRHRLFWTTPLISLSGGVLLAVVMILQDGIGGNGARRVLAVLCPEQKKTAIIQEQVSRTGVLLGTAFTIPEPVWITPIRLEDASVFNPLTSRIQQLNETGDHRSGDWFSSRAVQAQLIQAVRPSRGGVEFYPHEGGPPSVISSLTTPLRELFIVDDLGKVWTAQDLVAGVKREMKPSNSVDFKVWVAAQSHELGPVAQERARRLEGESGYAMAISDDVNPMAVPTLNSVRWGNQKILYVGPYEKH